jgi:hypothetical protein
MNTNTTLTMKQEKHLAEIVKEYAVVNEEKKDITAQAKELGDEIKETMGDADITEYTAGGWTAKIGLRETTKLDTDALLTWIAKQGLKIPAECYKTTVAEVLTVKPVVTEKKVA